jgi:hypothetical protein
MKTVVISLFALVCLGNVGWADVVYEDIALAWNFVPFGEDGTPNRPVPGDMLGNTITLDGTNRTLDRITIAVSTGWNPAVGTDTWTVALYLNDGPIDEASGLMQPGTLIAKASTDVTMPPFEQAVVFDFSSTAVVVPDSFTVVISSTHPTDTAGLVGPMSCNAPPDVGTGPNTMWYSSTAQGGWEANDTWAIADWCGFDEGPATNYLYMLVEASP